MTDIIDLASRRAAQWGAQVVIQPWPVGNARAELSGFWGHDGKEPAERCRMYAAALDGLAAQLRETADLLADPKPEPDSAT